MRGCGRSSRRLLDVGEVYPVGLTLTDRDWFRSSQGVIGGETEEAERRHGVGPHKRMTGGVDWTPFLPSALRQFPEEAERIGRRSFVHRRQVLVAAHALCGRCPALLLPPLRRGGSGDRGAFEPRGPRSSRSSDARGHRRGPGACRAHALGPTVPVSSLLGDGHGHPSRLRARTPIRGGGHRAGVRALRPERRESDRDTSAGVALEVVGDRVAVDVSMATRRRGWNPFRPRPTLSR
jgi:hypothetical protein